MPATNCPSDASFSDCASRPRSASRSFEAHLMRDVAGDEDVAGWISALIDQRRHRHGQRPAESRILQVSCAHAVAAVGRGLVGVV